MKEAKLLNAGLLLYYSSATLINACTLLRIMQFSCLSLSFLCAIVFCLIPDDEYRYTRKGLRSEYF